MTLEKDIEKTEKHGKLEKVMCIGPGAFAELKQRGLVQRGFTPWDSEKHANITNAKLACSMERTDELEKDEKFKQIIPYVVLSKAGRIFWYRRRSGPKDTGEGDKRLSGNISVGIGGHWQHSEKFVNCVNREYKEEVGGFPLQDIVYGTAGRRAMIDGIEYNDMSLFNTLFPVGLIWDESTPIGRSHIGILLQFELTLEVFPSDSAQLAGHEYGWSNVGEIVRTYTNKMEAWTAVAVRHGINRGQV